MYVKKICFKKDENCILIFWNELKEFRKIILIYERRKLELEKFRKEVIVFKKILDFKKELYIKEKS